MTKSEVKIGGKYRARVSGKTVTLLIEGAAGNGKGWVTKNLVTGRIVYLRSARRLSVLPTKRCGSCQACQDVLGLKKGYQEIFPSMGPENKENIRAEFRDYAQSHPCESPVEVK